MSPQTPDVVVVGGGVVAAAVTWQLARTGRRVQWLSGADTSTSGTLAAGAMLAVHSEVSADQDPGLVAIEVTARGTGRRLWDTWLPELEDAAGAEVAWTDTMTVVAATAADVASLQAIRDAAAIDGSKVLDVDPRDVPGLRPDHGSEPVLAVSLPDEAAVDSADLLRVLDGAIATLPRVVRHRIDVDVVEVEPGQVRVRRSDGLVVTADQVVLAAGIGTTALAARSGLDAVVPPMLSGRGVSLTVRAPRPVPGALRTPNRAFACGLHVLPRAGGTSYLGATNRLTLRPDLHGAPRLSELHDLMGGCVRELDRGLRDAELVGTSVGFRPVTLDRLPLVGRTAEPRVLLATATWRNGVVLAPYLASLVEQELSVPGATAGHAFAAGRTMTAAPLDEAAIRRAATGIVESILGADLATPGRAAELTALVAHTLSTQAGPDAHPDAPVARLLRSAPLEEALPLVLDLLLRGWDA
jgi:glycine oxidase